MRQRWIEGEEQRSEGMVGGGVGTALWGQRQADRCWERGGRDRNSEEEGNIETETHIQTRTKNVC